MREQVQVPFDSRGDTTSEKSKDKPKAISRPMVAEGLARPKQIAAYMRCSVCTDSRCDAPAYDAEEAFWCYFDADMNPLPDGSGPRGGVRFLPGGPT